MSRITTILQAVDVSWRRVWMALFLVSVAGMADIPSTLLLPLSKLGNWVIVLLIAAFKSTCLWGLLLLFSIRKCRFLSVVMWALTGTYALLCIINGATSHLYGMGITIKLMTVVAQTNRAEMIEFLPSLITAIGSLCSTGYTYLALITVIILFVACRWVSQRYFLIAIGLSSVAGLLSLVIVSCTLVAGRANYSIPLRVAKSVIQSNREQRQIMRELEKIGQLPDPQTVESSRLTDIIMVVGESASRDHLSLYGYPLQTTPRLDAMSDSLVIFDDVIGTSTLTAFNMNRILTFLSDHDPAGDWYKKPMLFSLLNEAGYETAWISNQEKSGIWGNSTVAMVSMASEIRFVGSISSDDATLQMFDEILLPEISEMLNRGDKAKFIGVQMMGSHIEYRRRYPGDFNIFTSDSIMNNKSLGRFSLSKARVLSQYDNSILYTDYILSQIIGMASRMDRPTLVIYFSDHGENVYDGGGDYCGRDERHVEVPFIIYPNIKFVSDNQELLQQLKESSGRPMTTAEISHLICTLTGTRYAAYADSLDVVSPAFAIRHRYVDEKPWKYEHSL